VSAGETKEYPSPKRVICIFRKNNLQVKAADFHRTREKMSRMAKLRRPGLN